MTQNARFPHSIQLFRFCFRVLASQDPHACEQHVGGLLDLTPSDTSHWKRGKRSIRSTEDLRQLASALDIDPYLIRAVAEGSLDGECAWMEFQDACAERKLLTYLGEEKASLRLARQTSWNQLAYQIHSQAQISSCPVHLTEIFSCFPAVQVTQGEVVEKFARGLRIKPGYYVLKHRKIAHPTASAHIRLAAARELAKLMLQFERLQLHVPEPAEDAQELWADANIRDFASALLVPWDALCAQVQQVPAHLDMIGALARSFWVPRSTICARLQCVLSYKETLPYAQTNPVTRPFVSPEFPQSLLLGR